MLSPRREGGFVHGTRPECRLGSGHTRSPNSLWSLSSAATEVKLAFRSQLRDLVLFNLWGSEPVAQREEDRWTTTAVSYLTEQPLACQATEPDVSLPTMTVQQKKVCSPPGLTSGTATSSYRTASILSDGEATRCSLLPPSIRAPLPFAIDLPGLAHTTPAFLPGLGLPPRYQVSLWAR